MRDLDVILARIKADLPVTEEELKEVKKYSGWLEARAKKTDTIVGVVTFTMFLAVVALTAAKRLGWI